MRMVLIIEACAKYELTDKQLLSYTYFLFNIILYSLKISSHIFLYPLMAEEHWFK